MQADPGSTLSFQPSNNLLGYPFTGRKGSANQIGMLGTNDLRLAQSQDIFDVGLPFPANSGAIHEGIPMLRESR